MAEDIEGQIREGEELDAEREGRRRLALAQVRQYPDPVLRLRARDVTEFDDALGSLVDRMGRLMGDARGVGLAAPQIGLSQRVLVYRIDEESPLVALVNPSIVDSSSEVEAGDEGCLSLGAATVVVPVERATRITIEAVDAAGERIRSEAEGLEARVIQH